MTTQLRDAFTDLAVGVASHVVTEDLGRTAWARGRRRRIRRRLASAALAVSVVAVITGLLLPVVGGPRSVSPGQDVDRCDGQGLSQRIANQWSIDDLPARPGPLAAVMQAHMDHPEIEGFFGWYGLSETGHRWRLNVGGLYDDIYPTISPNGRYLGYLAADAGPYVIHDVVTGKKATFRQVGMGERGTPYFVDTQRPSFWSPDGSRVAMFGMQATATSTSGALVLGVDGSFAFVEGAANTFLAGWANDDALIWLGWPWSQGELTPETEVTAHVRQLDGTVLSSIRLRPTAPWQGRFPGQWTGTGSADGREILVLEDVGFGTVVHRFSMTTGAESAQPASVSSYSVCAAVWVGSDVAVPVIDSTSDASNATTAVLRSGEVRPVTVIEPGVGSRCIVWATDALAGEAHGGLWGMSTSWLSWNWRETIVVTLLSVAAVWTLLRLTRPYRMRHPGRASSQA